MKNNHTPDRSKQRKPTPRVRRQAERRRQRYWMVAFGVAATLLVGAFILWPRVKAEPVPEARLTDDPALGSPDAQATIIEYGDFGCPSCQAWHRAGILRQLRATYGDRIRFVWRDFPVITAQSPQAAEAAQCAYDQGRFWEYHDLLYDRAPALSVSNLKGYSAEIGLSTEKFDRCLDSGQHQATVEQDKQEAFRLGLRGTPSFFVNGQLLVGPPSLDYLQSLIDPLLISTGP